VAGKERRGREWSIANCQWSMVNGRGRGRRGLTMKNMKDMKGLLGLRGWKAWVGRGRRNRITLAGPKRHKLD